jgi:replication-associated recombination protein RarA
MYYALEIAHEGKPSFGWLRNRLKIIAYEDIGLANPDVVLQVSKAVDDMNDFYQNNNSEWKIVLAHIILLLCRSEKNRINDHFKCAVKNLWDSERVPKECQIPDYALDMHTTRGNNIGRKKHSKGALRISLKRVKS